MKRETLWKWKIIGISLLSLIVLTITTAVIVKLLGQEEMIRELEEK